MWPQRQDDHRSPLATTNCRTTALVLLFVATRPAMAASEVTLIVQYLAGPVASMNQQATAAEVRASSTAPPLLDSPELAARQEVAQGPAGATTEAVGGGITLDLGLSALVERDAARLRGDASVPLHQTDTLSAICAVRAEALTSWTTTEEARVRAETLERLVSLGAALDALSAAGERSSYDRERLMLAVLTHRSAATAATGDAAAQRSRLSTLIGAPVDAVTLSALPPLPSLEEVRRQVQAHPQLIALRLERDAAERSVSAARRAAVPDLSLSGGLRWDTPPQGGTSSQGYELGAALELPVFANGRADIRDAEASLATAESRLSWQTAELTAAAEGAWHRASALQFDASISVALWESTQTRYRGGEADLEEVLQIAQALDEAHRAATEQQRQVRQAQLDLSCATGRFRVPEIQSIFEEHLP